MHWKIITVGRPALRWARDAVADYETRLSRYTRCERIAVPAGTPEENGVRMRRQAEGSHLVALHESGRRLRSLDFAKWIERHQLRATKSIAFLIGGADGHDDETLASVDETWSLSDFTLQHEIALVVLMEQVYRAHTILRGEPYHRE